MAPIEFLQGGQGVGHKISRKFIKHLFYEPPWKNPVSAPGIHQG